MTGTIALVPPYFENLGKRLVKSPKLYFLDAGLAAHLLGMESQTQLRASPLYDAHFESFIASELLKAQANAGRRPELYWFRDHAGLEVDFVLPPGGGRRSRPMLVEAKASRTVRPEMAVPLRRVAEAMTAAGHPAPQSFLVHEGASLGTSALAPGVQAIDLDGLLSILAPPPAGE